MQTAREHEVLDRILPYEMYDVIEREDLTLMSRYYDKYSFSIVDIDLHGDRPLHVAVRNGKYRATLGLLGKGARANVVDHKGYTAMHIAIMRAKEQVNSCPFIDILLRRGVNLNIPDGYGVTAAELLTYYGHKHASLDHDWRYRGLEYSAEGRLLN